MGVVHIPDFSRLVRHANKTDPINFMKNGYKIENKYGKKTEYYKDSETNENI